LFGVLGEYRIARFGRFYKYGGCRVFSFGVEVDFTRKWGFYLEGV